MATTPSVTPLFLVKTGLYSVVDISPTAPTEGKGGGKGQDNAPKTKSRGIAHAPASAATAATSALSSSTAPASALFGACRSSHPDALLALQVLAALLGLSVTFESTASLAVHENKLLVELDTQDANVPCRTLGGCARALCAAAPTVGLWGERCRNDDGTAAARVDSWVEMACSNFAVLAHVLPDARAKHPQFKAQVSQMAEVVEAFLFSTDSTYLVGDYMTAADVVVAIVLAKAAQRSGVTSVPQQTFRWMETVLKNDSVSAIVSSSISIPAMGKASPLEKPQGAAPMLRAMSKGSAGVVAAAKTAVSTPAAAAAPSSGGPSDKELADNPVVLKLKELGVAHKAYGHALCMTSEELETNVPLSKGEVHTKNLFFKDKKHGLFLLSVRSDAEVNTKNLGKDLGLEGKVNMRLADEAVLMESLGVKKGCVGPLAMMNDAKQQVTLVLDEGLTKAAKVHSHPLRNDASVVLTPTDLISFVTKVSGGREPTMLAFGAKEGAAAASAAPAPAAAKPPKVEGKKKSVVAVEDRAGSVDAQQQKNKRSTKKGETLLALQWKKAENFAMWYSDVIVLSEMISYYDISGCYILRPWSYQIWEHIQEWFNKQLRELEVDNAYFPLFVSKDRLEKEKDHVEGFSPEVAWVTKSGDGTLAKPIAIRPTSETIMYPAYSDWIKSHRDLPLKLNQWSNVVRWEFKDPTPFLRTREFLWQEGHTAHVSFEDANDMVQAALELYRGVYEELLAVPVIKGFKTEKEKFAGGHQTTTVEAYIPVSGRAIQGATSHHLGQNFGKMFDITFQDEAGESQVAWQTSWGLTTRTIGVMVMVHGDDTGLVLPPQVAPLQVVIVPIVNKNFTLEKVTPYCQDICQSLRNANIRVKFDNREMYNPGWKYNHWEQKGVPIRIEVGPRDLESKQVRLVVRFNGEKMDVAVKDVVAIVSTKLVDIQAAMFSKALQFREDHLVQVTEWKDFVPQLELRNLVLTPWCGGEYQEWEEWVKDKSREESLQSRGEGEEDARAATSVAAKTLCIPFDQPELPEGTKCIASGMPAKCWILWGRSY